MVNLLEYHDHQSGYYVTVKIDNYHKTFTLFDDTVELELMSRSQEVHRSLTQIENVSD